MPDFALNSPEWIERYERDVERGIDYAKIDRLVILAMDRRDAGLCDTQGCPNQGNMDRCEEGFYCDACWGEIEE